MDAGFWMLDWGEEKPNGEFWILNFGWWIGGPPTRFAATAGQGKANFGFWIVDCGL